MFGLSTRRSLGVGIIVVAAVSSLFVVGAAAGWLPGGSGRMWGGHGGGPSSQTVYLNLTITTSASTGADQFFPANLTIPHGSLVILKITNHDTGVNPTVPMWQHVMGTRSGTESVSYGGHAVPVSSSWISDSYLSHTFSLYPDDMMSNGSMMNGSAGSGLLGGGSGGSYGNGSMGSGGSGLGGGGMMGNGSNHSGSNSTGMGGGMGGAGMGGGMGMLSGMLGATPDSAIGVMLNLPIPAATSNATPAVVVAVFTVGSSGSYTWHCAAPCDASSMATLGFMRGSLSVT